MNNKNMPDSKVIKRDVKALDKQKEIRLGNSFLSEYIFDKDITDIPINALRIIFKIANDIRNEQFQKPNTKQKLETQKHHIKQLSLFEEDFKSEHNTYASFRFKRSEITDSKNRLQIEKVLLWLEEYKKDWYTSVNEKGEKIRTLGGLISNASYTKGEISFLVSAYWLEKLCFLPTYNTYLNELVSKTNNNKYILFYLWLGTIKETGTMIKVETFNEKFGFNYEYKALNQKFLALVKSFLDTHSDLSFNYTKEGNCINIMPYHNTVIEENIQKVTELKVKQKLQYWRRRYELNSDQMKTLKAISLGDFRFLIDGHDLFIQTIRIKKLKVADYKGQDFLEVFQKCIIQVYRNSRQYQMFPNSHPKVI